MADYTLSIDRPFDGERDYHVVVNDQEHSTGYICARATLAAYRGYRPPVTLVAMVYGDIAEVPDDPPGDAIIGEEDPDNDLGWFFSYIPEALAAPSPGATNVLAVWVRITQNWKEGRKYDDTFQPLATSMFYGISAEATECGVNNNKKRIKLSKIQPEPHPENKDKWCLHKGENNFTGDVKEFDDNFILKLRTDDPDDYVWDYKNNDMLIELRVPRLAAAVRLLTFMSKDKMIQLQYSLAVENWRDDKPNRVWAESFVGLKKKADAAKSVRIQPT